MRRHDGSAFTQKCSQESPRSHVPGIVVLGRLSSGGHSLLVSTDLAPTLETTNSVLISVS
jgi:hypothetical protein